MSNEKVVDLSGKVPEPEDEVKVEGEGEAGAGAAPEPEVAKPVGVDPVLQALSAYSANLSFYTMQGILGYVSKELGYLSEDDFTEFAREVLSEYRVFIEGQDYKSLRKVLYNPKKRTDLILGFLWSLKPQYRNACMQLLLQNIACFEIAGRTFKIQSGLHNADPGLTDSLKEAFFESLKPELRDDVLAIVDSLFSFLKQYAPTP